MLLIGDVPNGGKPHTKPSSCLIKNGSSSDRRLMATGWADQSGATASVNFSDHATFGANKAIRPTKLLQIFAASLLRIEPIKKLNPCRWVVNANGWFEFLCIQRLTLPTVELKGYLVIVYRIYPFHNSLVLSCKNHVVWRPQYFRSALVDGADEAPQRVVERVCLARDAHLIESG